MRGLRRVLRLARRAGCLALLPLAFAHDVSLATLSLLRVPLTAARIASAVSCMAVAVTAANAASDVTRGLVGAPAAAAAAAASAHSAERSSALHHFSDEIVLELHVVLRPTVTSAMFSACQAVLTTTVACAVLCSRCAEAAIHLPIASSIAIAIALIGAIIQ